MIGNKEMHCFAAEALHHLEPCWNPGPFHKLLRSFKQGFKKNYI